ncbi:MAG: hypothetical protein L3J37_02570 [Rhodobacteraceae bacterium]|nr:hypothetical protein [Paracoccaceae bacterium]
MKTVRYLWQNHRLLLIGFGVAALVTTLFLVKFTVSMVYWSNNRNASIEPWMPIGYIAHSYEVDRNWLLEQTGLPEGEGRPHQSIKDTAAAADISYDDMRIRLLEAIKAEREK